MKGFCMSQSISQKFTPVSLLKFALPSMVMMVFMSCYTIVDGIFISRYLGSEKREVLHGLFFFPLPKFFTDNGTSSCRKHDSDCQ